MLISSGLFVLWLFAEWEHRRERVGREPLIQMSMFRIPQLDGGLIMFFFQFLIQAGLFFVIPLYLSVALGLSAIDTGLKIMPLSITCSRQRSASRGTSRAPRRGSWCGSACSPCSRAS